MKIPREEQAILRDMWQQYGGWEIIRNLSRWESGDEKPPTEAAPKTSSLFEAIRHQWGLSAETPKQAKRVKALEKEFRGKGCKPEDITKAVSAYHKMFPSCPTTPDAVCKHFEILMKDTTEENADPNSIEYQLKSRGFPCTDELIDACSTLPMSDVIQLMEAHADAHDLLRSIRGHDQHGCGNGVDRNHAPQPVVHTASEGLHRLPPTIHQLRSQGDL